MHFNLDKVTAPSFPTQPVQINNSGPSILVHFRVSMLRISAPLYPDSSMNKCTTLYVFASLSNEIPNDPTLNLSSTVHEYQTSFQNQAIIACSDMNQLEYTRLHRIRAPSLEIQKLEATFSLFDFVGPKGPPKFITGGMRMG